MVKINNETVYPELPLEFTLDGTEEFRKGTLKLDNLEQVTPYDDYSKVDITVNGIDYRFILESDLPNRVAKDITTHQITLLEEVVNLNDVMIPDRAFTTTGGIQTTWKYQLETIIETSSLEFTVETDTLALLNVTANNQQYSGSFLNFLVIAFRAVDAIPTLSDGVIGHNLLNEKNNDVTTEVETILNNDSMESRRYEANINDYASSVYSKVKNGSYEESEEIGETYFPSKTGYVSVRSSSNKYDDNTSQIQFNNGTRRISEGYLNLNVKATISSIYIFGSVGDLRTDPTSGYQATCDTDGYYSAVSGETYDNGDTATWLYDRWFTNFSEGLTHFLDVDITKYIYSKEAWSKLKISTDEFELKNGIFQNNTFYYSDGGNTLDNIGNEYDLGFGWSKDTAYEACLKAIEEEYSIILIGSSTLNELRYAQWRFKYIPSRDYDTDVERHTSERVKYKSTKTNQQQESRVEIGKYGKANYQFVNRMGNNRFEITVRYFESDTYGRGINTYADMLELFDYYNNYKIVKIKYMIYSNMIDCQYLFVANQSNLNPNSAFTSPVSPFTIQDKLEAKTCYVRKHYLVFGDLYEEDTLNATTKLILWNRFDYSVTYDKPIYTAVYESADSYYTNDSDVKVNVDVALDVQRAIEGRGFTFNTQFNSKTVAGSKIVATGIGSLAHKLTPINYTDEYGEVGTCVIHYCNDVGVTAEDYPIADSYTTIFGDYTRTVKLQPNEILGETQRIECISDRENLFIYKNFLLNNSILREIDEGITLKVQYYDKPIFTTDTKGVPYTTQPYDVTVSNYKLVISPPSVGLSYAIVDSVTEEIYFAYNNVGEELTTINMTMSSFNVNLSGKGIWIYYIRANASDLANLTVSSSIAVTKEFRYISAEVIDLADITGSVNLVKTKEFYTISAEVNNLSNITGEANIAITKIVYYISAEAQDIANLTSTVILNKTKDLYYISAIASNISNISGSVDASITKENYIISASASSISNVTGSISYTYSDPLVEWVEVTSGTVTGGNCYVTADIGNIVELLSDCLYVTDGSGYTSSTNQSIPQKVCSDGAEYTLCIYDSFLGIWNCQDYVGELQLAKFECQLK